MGVNDKGTESVSPGIKLLILFQCKQTNYILQEEMSDNDDDGGTKEEMDIFACRHSPRANGGETTSQQQQLNKEQSPH